MVATSPQATRMNSGVNIMRYIYIVVLKRGDLVNSILPTIQDPPLRTGHAIKEKAGELRGKNFSGLRYDKRSTVGSRLASQTVYFKC